MTYGVFWQVRQRHNKKIQLLSGRLKIDFENMKGSPPWEPFPQGNPDSESSFLPGWTPLRVFKPEFHSPWDAVFPNIDREPLYTAARSSVVTSAP
jgi:hypothetical protein